MDHTSSQTPKHTTIPAFGVGLRHQHYQDCLNNIESNKQKFDFIEVHAENFFMDGGASIALLEEVRSHYPVSIHATSLGLGSLTGIPKEHTQKLKRLIDHIDPFLVSDHACFAWYQNPVNSKEKSLFHAGDLLPIAFNQHTLEVMARNVNETHDLLGRSLLIENLSAYVDMPTQENNPSIPEQIFNETEFLVALCEKTDAKLLVDLNNLLVNACNDNIDNGIAYAQQWVESIPTHLIGEIHLAGCTPVEKGNIMVDDHSHPISDDLWQLYQLVNKKIQHAPILVEWDNQLPSWQTLTNEVIKAKKFNQQLINT